MNATDEARAEAHRRYEPSKLIEDYDGDRYVDDEWGYDECQRRAFVAGAAWQASHPITDEMVDIVQERLYDDMREGDRPVIRAALEAARGVQS